MAFSALTLLWARQRSKGLILTVLLGCTCTCSKDPECPPGTYRAGGRCHTPDDGKAERYAACVLKDQTISSDKGNEFVETLNVAKVTSTTTADLRDKFEASIQASTDRCYLYKVSDDCFNLVVGKVEPARPREGCTSVATTTGDAMTPPSVSAGTPTQVASQPRPPRCANELADYKHWSRYCDNKNCAKMDLLAEREQCLQCEVTRAALLACQRTP